MKKIKVKEVLFFLFFIVLGASLGVGIGMSSLDIRSTDIILTTFLLVLFFILHIVIHEAGHLVFGLLTGHRFLSFRIFSYCLVKRNNQLKLTKLKVPGTLGQCLLIPPPLEKGKFPFQLYLLGGVMFNFIFSALSLLLIKLNPVLILEFSILGVILGLSNLIPMGFNDGSTLKLTRASAENQQLLYIQLASNAQMTEGSRFTDLPDSYFELIKANPERTYFNDFQEFLVLGRYFEEMNWFEYGKMLENFWERKNSFIFLYQLELDKEMLFYLLITNQEDKRIPVIQKNTQVSRYLKTATVSNKRVLAADAFYRETDKEKALNLIEQGLSMEDKTSNLGEFYVERDILKWLQQEMEASS